MCKYHSIARWNKSKTDEKCREYQNIEAPCEINNKQNTENVQDKVKTNKKGSELKD